LLENVEAEAFRPFNLSEGPLVRVVAWSQPTGEHILLLASHHLAADFWSFAVALRELAHLLRPGEETGAALPPLLRLYSDYVDWQERLLSGQRGTALEAFWRTRLSGAPTVLELPTDRPRPPIQTYGGGSVALQIDEEMAIGLRSLAQAEGATLNMVLLAVFEILLHRYTGQEDFLLGSPAVGRTRAGFASLVGYFANPVVLRADFARTPGFKELLRRVRRSVIESLEHQDYPFPLLAERLVPARDSSHSPIFQAMFVLLGSQRPEERDLAAFALGVPDARLTVGELALESVPLRERTSQFDLTLRIGEMRAGLAASLQYNSSLFDRVTAQRLLGHFANLLSAVIAVPECRVADLPLLPPPERAQILREWNDTAVADPADACLQDLFEAQVRRTPDADAVVWGTERVTYAELGRRANRLAHYLRRVGVRPEVRVGVLLSRSVDMVSGLLGVLKAGGAYVPLDPAYPTARLELMAADASLELILTEERWLDLFVPAARRVCVDREHEAIASSSSEDPVPWTVPGHLAYVIYTSGSTGRPKGVAIEHRSAVVLARWAGRTFSSDELKGVLASTSICFDLSVFELFVPLSRGGKVILADNALELP
jgi:non-ribosomal peptide synthetase component F